MLIFTRMKLSVAIFFLINIPINKGMDNGRDGESIEGSSPISRPSTVHTDETINYEPPDVDPCVISEWIESDSLLANCQIRGKLRNGNTNGYKVKFINDKFTINIATLTDEDRRRLFSNNKFGFLCANNQENQLNGDYSFGNVDRYMKACTQRKTYKDQVTNLNLKYKRNVLTSTMSKLKDLPATLRSNEDDENELTCTKTFDTLSYLCHNIPRIIQHFHGTASKRSIFNPLNWFSKK